MKFIKKFFLFSLILGTPLLSSATDFTTKCDKFPAPLPGGYCVHIPNSNGSGDILYHLHGAGNSELTWGEEWYYTSQIRKEWKQHGFQVPTVVSVSFGPIWLLAEKNTSPQSGLLELFTQTIMPMIESKIGNIKRRVVFGESMGGFNSVQLAFKTDLFDKVGILCAPMTEVSPFLNKEDLYSHVKKSSAWQYYKDHDPESVLRHVDRLVELATAFYPTEEDWKKADPLQLAKRRKSAKSPKFYSSAGFYDVYALYEGNELFAERLKKRGFDIEWRPMWGGHCTMDIPSLAKFLLE